MRDGDVEAAAPTNDGSDNEGGVLDEGLLGMIRDISDATGNADLLRDLVDQFTSHAVGRMEQLREAVSRRDAPLLEGAAHGLKGSSGALGATRLAAACEVLEAAGRSGELAGLEPQLEQVEHELKLATDALLIEIGPARPREGPA